MCIHVLNEGIVFWRLLRDIMEGCVNGAQPLLPRSGSLQFSRAGLRATIETAMRCETWRERWDDRATDMGRDGGGRADGGTFRKSYHPPGQAMISTKSYVHLPRRIFCIMFWMFRKP